MEDEDEERSLTLTGEVPDDVDVGIIEGIIDAKDERMKWIRPSIASSSGMFIALSFAVASSREVVAWEDADAAAAAL